MLLLNNYTKLLLSDDVFYLQKFTFHFYPTDLLNTKTNPRPWVSAHYRFRISLNNSRGYKRGAIIRGKAIIR